MDIIPPRPVPTPVTDKAAMAEVNRIETENAHKLAADRRAQEANQPPLIQTLQDSIKQKLEELPKEPAPEQS